jgi:hypothetical protein
VEQITCRSPAKPVSRIEDSVEALDQLEEALEAIDQAALTERIVSPTDRRLSKIMAEKAKAVAPEQKSLKQGRNPKATTMRVKPTAPRAPVMKRATSAEFKSKPIVPSGVEQSLPPKKALLKRPISLLPPRETVSIFGKRKLSIVSLRMKHCLNSNFLPKDAMLTHWSSRPDQPNHSPFQQSSSFLGKR